jgi:ribonucleoside-diphosphate reductase alpha subunit
VLIEFVKAAFVNMLGVDHITVSKDQHHMVTIVVNNTIVAALFKKIFKCKFDGKRLPSFFNRLSYENIKYFIAGLVSSDGCVSKTNSITIQLTNPPLVNDIFYLARSVGIPLTVTFMGATETKKATGRMSVPGDLVNGHVKKYYEDDRLETMSDVSWKQFRSIDGTMFVRINNKTISAARPHFVYTFGVEDDHSYSVGGIVAENCFLLDFKADSIKGIYETLGDCAQISKWAGGIGLAAHKIRAKNSRIQGTNGVSTGIVPMLKVFNDTARYVNQGGKRNGSFAVYLEPWHADIEDFLRLKLNTGAEEDRARDLFYGLWIPDEFMRRVKEDKDWTLMCPHECPGLSDVHSEEFTVLYRKYEAEGKGRKAVPAQKLWQMILDAQIQTGTPYLCYKDAGNFKSNQKNLGTIKSSNLCSEIFEYTDAGETAVCNLGSLSLTKFVKEDKTYDFDALRHYVAILARNLDIVIDRNYYPTPESRESNMRHRPIGIGVQGLADVLAKMRITWSSPEAADLNRRIFEHIYYAALHTSYNIAVDKGSYPSFEGSPASQGILQPDLWRVNPLSEDLDWQALRHRVKKGLRNSLSIALMPTASTSQILGNNECFEPFTSNLYVRHVLAGDFIVINKYLISELVELGVWSPELRTSIIANNGSVLGVQGVPPDVQERYRTAWEIPMKTIINLAADRAPFVCQSQSLNLFVADPSYARLSSMHIYAWEKGLKTGCYYLRTKAVASAQKFTVEPEARPQQPDCLTCSA